MPMLYKKLSVISASIVLIVLPIVALAADPACPIALSAVNATNAGQWFKCIIINILNIVVWPIFIAASIIMFIWAGFLFLNSHGDPGKIGEARKALTWAAVGVVVGVVGYSAVGILRGLLGL